MSGQPYREELGSRYDYLRGQPGYPSLPKKALSPNGLLKRPSEEQVEFHSSRRKAPSSYGALIQLSENRVTLNSGQNSSPPGYSSPQQMAIPFNVPLPKSKQGPSQHNMPYFGSDAIRPGNSSSSPYSTEMEPLDHQLESYNEPTSTDSPQPFKMNKSHQDHRPVRYSSNSSVPVKPLPNLQHELGLVDNHGTGSEAMAHNSIPPAPRRFMTDPTNNSFQEYPGVGHESTNLQYNSSLERSGGMNNEVTKRGKSKPSGKSNNTRQV